MISEQVAKKLPQKALTHGAVYPIVKKVAGYLGVRITTQSFATTVSKAIPLIGAAVSGGLTFATYLPMAKRLKKHLAGLPLAEPPHAVAYGDVVDGEVVEDHEEPAAAAHAEQLDADTTAVKLEEPQH